MQSYAYNKKGGKFQKKPQNVWDCFFVPQICWNFQQLVGFCFNFCALETKKTPKSWEFLGIENCLHDEPSRSSSKPDMSQFQALEAKCLGMTGDGCWRWLAARQLGAVGCQGWSVTTACPPLQPVPDRLANRTWIAVVMGDGGVSSWAKGAHSHVATLGELWAQESRCQHYHSTSTILHLDSVAHRTYISWTGWRSPDIIWCFRNPFLVI